MNIKRDTLQEANLTLSEADAGSEVDGKHVLAKVKGTFFVPNGVSRNKRFYPKDLWEKAIANPTVKSMIANRTMFGTIGHEQALDDSAFREGKFSHFVTNLAIEGNDGIGEALILDTPVGRVLNTILRAGSKLYVSSRASGSYKGETKDGMPIVNPDDYALTGFDFVLDPGFLQANPSLVESLNKEDLAEANLILTEKVSPIEDPVPNNDVTKIKENKMDKELLEQMAKEKVTLKADLEKAVTQNEKLSGENLILADEAKTLNTKLEKFEAQEKELAEYRKLGSPKEISDLMSVSEKTLDAYEKLGTPALIEKALGHAKTHIESNKAFFAEMGSKEEIKSAVEIAEKTVDAYAAFGSPKEIGVVFENHDKVINKHKDTLVAEKITKLAKELGVSEEKIKAVHGKLTEAEIKTLFAGMKVQESKTSAFRKTTATPPAADPAKVTETVVPKRNSASSLMESISR